MFTGPDRESGYYLNEVEMEIVTMTSSYADNPVADPAV